MNARVQNVGIEYELEGLRYGSNDWEEQQGRLPNWRVVHDGTLRGRSAEFVSGILDIKQAPSCVDRLLNLIDAEYDNSHRCSMHIHVSISELRKWQRIALYMALVAEESFFFQFNPDRKKNHYCTPLLYTPAFYQGLSLMAQTPDWQAAQPVRMADTLIMRSLYGGSCKYTSVNVQPALSGGFGTLELRHFAPLMQMEQVNTILDKIKELTDLIHDCPYNRSASMYQYLANNVDSFSSAPALTWVIEAVKQIEQETLKQGKRPKAATPNPSLTTPDREADRAHRAALMASLSDSAQRAGWNPPPPSASSFAWDPRPATVDTYVSQQPPTIEDNEEL